MNLSLTTDDLLQADRRAVKRALMSWGTGRNHTGEAVRPGRCAVVVLDNADALPDVLAAGLVDADSTVFAGGVDDQGPLSREPGRPRVVGYQGSAAKPGEELSIGDDFFLQIQDYATSEYMSLLGPTLIRICGPQDFATFLADADRARQTGNFAEFATNPAVQFADQSAYGATLLDGAGVDGPELRLWVDGAGQVSTSPNGSLLGSIGDGFAALHRKWREINAGSGFPCAVSLGGSIGQDERAAALTARPWLPDYLMALDAMKDLHARGRREIRVSGFGGRRSTALADVPASAESARPVLLWNEDGAYLVDQRIGRTFGIDEATADAVEAVLVLGSVETATAVVDPARLRSVASSFAAAGVLLDSREPAGV
jgi:hypothetical protein